MTRKEILDILPFVELLTAVTILHIPPPQLIPATIGTFKDYCRQEIGENKRTSFTKHALRGQKRRSCLGSQPAAVM